MKKRILSIVLSLTVLLGILVPGFSGFAQSPDNSVTVIAESDNNITIEKEETLPTESDYNGELELTAGLYDIERDYSQACMLTVKNNSKVSVEYYLVVENVYTDLYMNFVRSGSVDIPLVIGAGETQEVQLDVFAQNATKDYYVLPVYAHIVNGDSDVIDAKVTAELRCPTVSLNVSCDKISENENSLSQTYKLKNHGDALTDITVSMTGEAKDYVSFSPAISNYPMNKNQEVEFAIKPDLLKMKNNNTSKISGEIVVSSGGSERTYTVEFDTKGQEIVYMTIGELAALQDGVTPESISTNSYDKGAITNDYLNPQCTNAGQTKVDVQLGDFEIIGTNSISTNSLKPEDFEFYVTNRMYGGDGVNRWYGSTDTDYVDIADTTYTYTLNGKRVGTSYNSGVTDLSIVKLPTEYLKFGSNNVLICDYDTNPGHYFVTANTQITFVIPGDTPVCYIGSPAGLDDVRSLPDFAIYSENIFSSDKNIIVGNETEISFKVYNRGSQGGTFDITVTDGSGSIYTEKNRYLDAFSGDEISFNWTPSNDEENITVTLTNTSVGITERDSENNVASRTFKSRERVVPRIDSITPDYAVVGEGIVYATVSKYDDVIKTEFYVDDVLYSGEVKSSTVNGKIRYWINDPSMSMGAHTIKVVVTYATGTTSTAQIESSATIDVLDKDWNKYVFSLDSTFTNPDFYLYNALNKTYSYAYNVYSTSGNNYVYTITKEIYDAPENYYIVVASDEGFVYKPFSDKTDKLNVANCNKLTWLVDNTLSLNDVTVKSFDGKAIYANLSDLSEIYLTPAKYEFEVDVISLGEYKSTTIEVDITDGNKIVDLTDYFTSYTFKFAEEIEGFVTASMYYKNAGQTTWESVEMLTQYNEDTVSCALSTYYTNLLANAEEAFICIATYDSVFTTDIKPFTKDLPDVITLSKSNQQKYTLTADGNGADFDVYEVSVSCDKFSVYLYSTTVYLPSGEYEIVVYCKDGSDVALASQSLAEDGILTMAEGDYSNITVEWSDSFLDTGAYIYGTSGLGASFSQSEFASGNMVPVSKGAYSVKTNINRNESYYSILSSVDANADAKISIEDSFSGRITNTFGTCKGNSSVRIYLDDLFDANGNELTYFNSQREEDNLVGYLTFTNINNPDDKYEVFVSLSEISSFDVTLPNIDGTYSVKLEVSTENDVLRKVNKVELNETEITLNCAKSYQLIATVTPENATNANVTWTSSNEKIATVDENGNVKANFAIPGTTYITVTTEDGAYSATCKVTVKYSWWQWLICAVFGVSALTALLVIIF